MNVARDLATTSVSLTRGGPLMARGPGWTTNLSLAPSHPARASRSLRRTSDDGVGEGVTGAFDAHGAAVILGVAGPTA